MIKSPVMLKPVLHGGVGVYDELCGLLPLILGLALYLWLYFTSKERTKAERGKEREG